MEDIQEEGGSTGEPRLSLIDHLCVGDLLRDLKPIDAKGQIVTIACNRFWLDIVPKIPFIQGDRRSLADFISISILPFWTPSDTRKPILEYTQREARMVMEGVEWNLSGDIYFRGRDRQWFREVLQIMELIMLRCMYFYSQGEMPVTVLDDAEYCDVNTIEHTDVKLATVNYKFLFEMETLFTSSIWTCFEARIPVEMAPPVDTEALRIHVFSYANYLGDPEIVSAWREYYQGLISSKAHRAIHYFRVPHDVRPSMRTVLAYKDTELSVDKFTTKSEIMGRHSNPMDKIISLDSLFVMYCKSLRRKSGDPIAALVDAPTVPRLTFCRGLSIWVLEPVSHLKIGFISISSAFVYFRLNYPDIKQKGRTVLDIKFN